MDNRTKRVMTQTIKNFLGLMGFILAAVGFVAAVAFLKTYFGFTAEALFAFTFLPAVLFGSVWLCYLKAREDVSNLEYKEARTMETLKQEFES